MNPRRYQNPDGMYGFTHHRPGQKRIDAQARVSPTEPGFVEVAVRVGKQEVARRFLIEREAVAAAAEVLIMLARRDGKEVPCSR